MLIAEHISSGYGGKQVLYDISFTLRDAEIVLLTGANGSGKSTLLKTLYGLLPAYPHPHASLSFDGDNILGVPTHRLLQRGLVYIPQQHNSFAQLTVKENLEVAALHLKNRPLTKKRLGDVLDMMPELAALRTRKPFYLSGGEKQQLALGMALMQKPRLLLLDEPEAGLAPAVWRKSLDIITSLNWLGAGFLIAGHNIKEDYSIAGRIIRLTPGGIFSDK